MKMIKIKYMFAFLLLISMMPTRGATLMVQVNYDNHQHQVVNAWLVEQTLPAHFAITGRKNDIRAQLFDEKNRLLKTVYANQAAPIRGAYLLASDEERKALNGNTIALTKGSYFLRIAHYDKTMSTLKLAYPKLNRVRGKLQWEYQQTSLYSLKQVN